MNTLKKLKVNELREKIVQDVDVTHIMDYMIQHGAITIEDKNHIYQTNERTVQTRHLLDLLYRKGPKAYDNFIESLKQDYSWLYKEFTGNTCQNDSIEEENFNDILQLGGVPYSPLYNVTREKKLNEVQKHLKNLKRGRYVVLHGMTGSGKSCLAADSVSNKELLINVFKGSIFWLTIGYCNSDEELLCHMNNLLQRLTPLEFSSSNIAQNASPFDIASSKVRIKEQLKICFLHDRLREGLLVLDDVTSTEQVDAFDIGCKILIVTKDLLVMKKVSGRHEVIRINGGFTENESLSLMAQSIDVNVQQLPPEAKKVHSLSLGTPIIIALIAGQLQDNKDDVLSSLGRWQYYVQILSEKEFSRSLDDEDRGCLTQAISLSINNLPSEKKKLYLDFAVFMADVNIKPEVLQTLWCFNSKYDVERDMTYFEKKSLAALKWSNQLESYVYGIHDILLDYLKKQFNDEERKNLHRKLLARYSDKCNGKFAKLPNDNYIYSYIGYHMFEAKESSMFSEVFLDLEFIQSKLRITGPTDLLGDFKKYREEITCKNKELEGELEDLIGFVQTHGLDLWRYEELDVVQCGLLEKKDSSVYKKAYNIAQNNPQKLYLEILSSQAPASSPLILPVREEIFAACFTNDRKSILIGDSSGLIKLWKLDSFEMMHSFKGHLFKVTYLLLDPYNDRFLSCSEDGLLKLWDIENFLIGKTYINTTGCNHKVSSPKNHQPNWNSMFQDDSPKDDSLKTFSKHDCPVICAEFSKSGKEIISCSKNKYIVWDCDSTLPLLKLEGGGVASCCSFSCDDTLLFLGRSDSNVNIFKYNNKSAEFVGSFHNSSNVIATFSDPLEVNKILCVCQKDITIWHWDEPCISQPMSRAINLNEAEIKSVKTFSMGKISKRTFGEKTNFDYVCAAASTDGQYLVVASSDYVLAVWNLKTEFLLAEHKNYRGLARCLDWSNDSTPRLLCGSEDRTVKVWHIDHPGAEITDSLMSHFDSVWIMKDANWLPIIASSDSRNRIQVLHGSDFIRTSSDECNKISVCVLSDTASYVFYGCDNGEVKKFDIDNSTSVLIMKLASKILYLQYHYDNNLSFVVAGDSTSMKLWKEDGLVTICYGQTSPVVQTFLLYESQKLLACNEDASVKLWNMEDGSLGQIVTSRSSVAHITCADVSEHCNLLVMGDRNACFHLLYLTLYDHSPYLKVESVSTTSIKSQDKINLENQPDSVNCCTLSLDNSLLVLGLHSGNILVWRLKPLQQLKILKLHNSAVQCVMFAQYNKENYFPISPALLVSVGEKIGWWNLTDLCAVYKTSTKSGSSLTSSVEVISNECVNHCDKIMDLLKKDMLISKSNLLSCIKLIGSSAQKISPSPDFSYFFTVDASGIIYLLRVLQ